jgi:hypothetical protein
MTDVQTSPAHIGTTGPFDPIHYVCDCDNLARSFCGIDRGDDEVMSDGDGHLPCPVCADFTHCPQCGERVTG